jgi:hypothetical protein
MGQYKNGSDPTDRARDKTPQKSSRNVFPGELFVTLPLRLFEGGIFSDDRLRGKAIHDSPPAGAGAGDVADRPAAAVDSDSADWYVRQSEKPRPAVAPETLFLWERRQ